LEVYGAVLVKDWEDGGGTSGWEPSRAGEFAGSGVGTDLVGLENLVAERAGVQPVER
jgi:hypothetical protein